MGHTPESGIFIAAGVDELRASNPIIPNFRYHDMTYGD